MEAVLIGGITVGAMYALVGIGLVVQYRYSRVVNLAHGGQALLAAYIFNDLRDSHFVLAALAGVGAATAVGVLIEYLSVERLRSAPLLVRMVVTLGVLLAILGFSAQMWGTQATFVTSSLFTSSTVTIGGVVVAGDQLVLILFTLVAATALGIFFRKTAVGTIMRAAGDRPVLAQTLGIDSTNLGRMVWAGGGALAGIAGILLTPLLNLDPVVYTLLVVVAYTAVLIGRMESIGLTAAGGFAVGIAQSLADYQWSVFGIQQIVAFVAALLALLIGAKQLEWSETQEVL